MEPPPKPGAGAFAISSGEKVQAYARFRRFSLHLLSTRRAARRRTPVSAPKPHPTARIPAD
jgi:hypothetical protein